MTATRIRTAITATLIGAAALALTACGSDQDVPSNTEPGGRAASTQSTETTTPAADPTATPLAEQTEPEAVIYAYVRQLALDPAILGAASQADTLTSLSAYYTPEFADLMASKTDGQDVEAWDAFALYGFTDIDTDALGTAGAVDTIKIPSARTDASGAYVTGVTYTVAIPMTDGSVTKVDRTQDFHLVPASTTTGPQWQIDGITGHSTVTQE